MANKSFKQTVIESLKGIQVEVSEPKTSEKGREYVTLTLHFKPETGLRKCTANVYSPAKQAKAKVGGTMITFG